MLRLLLVRGLSAIVASVVASAIVLGLIDYVVRFRDRGVLAIFTACVLGIFAWTFYRLLSRLSRVRVGDTQLALQVEAAFPAVKDRLASAVEFLTQAENDKMAGSAAMRRAAITEATAKCDEIDFGRALNLHPAFRAALASLAVCLVAAGLVVLNPAAARTALARLALPLGNNVWPQQTHLKFKNRVERVARGQALDLEVVDAFGTQLPAVCRIHYRTRDAQGRRSEETETMRPAGQAMIARRENITRPFECRVTGGDDQSMPWVRIEVLDPPAVASLSLDLFPPGYTNWPHETRDAASPLPILAGSRVELSGEASKPLRSAVLHCDGGRDIPARVEGDSRHFRFGGPSPELPQGLVLDKPSAYTITLVDREGILGGGDESWQFRVQADAPPNVVIEQPRGDLFLTPAARIDLRVDARDDLGLRRVFLIFSSLGATVTGESSLSLYEGLPQAAASSDGGADGQRQTIDRRWNLAELKLQPGTQLTICAAATDYRPQTGRSEPRTLTIISLVELQERLTARQRQILAELSRLLQLQREARETVRGVAIRLHETGDLEQAEIDRLQSAEFNQRDVARRLSDRGDGVPALARRADRLGCELRR